MFKCVAVLIIGVFSGVATAGLVFVLSLPHCPTEDSCRPDYREHKALFGLVHYKYWTGVPQIP